MWLGCVVLHTITPSVFFPLCSATTFVSIAKILPLKGGDRSSQEGNMPNLGSTVKSTVALI